MFSECEHCGEMRPNHSIYLIEGQAYCSICADDLFWWCEGCEEYHSYESEEPIAVYGDYFCESSCERLFVLCSDCGNYYEEMILLKPKMEKHIVITVRLKM